MASIHGQPVTTFIGRLHKAEQRIGLIQPMPGFDGYAVGKSGWAAEPVEVRTLTTVNTGQTAAEQLEERYRALHGVVGTVIDSLGRFWPNVTVLNVRTELHRTVETNVFTVLAVWRLLPETRRPA